MGEVKAAFDWIDVTRTFVPETRRSIPGGAIAPPDWEASDRGRRLDHVWFSQGLKGAATKHAILKEMRGWKQPSDHVPVVVEFDSD